ncbi:MAG: hypothetical protein O7E52_13085 [Candidatus Poribacteria bacterium]|nr:hypothetical protein [Candidatus Poribacteria bacterium]
MEWTTFGWSGITVEIPVDWELSGLSGDEKSGYLRLDDSEMPRLELKWSEAKRKKPDLQGVLDEYFKLVRKNYKRKDAHLHIQRDVKLIKDEQFFEGREVVFFSWKGEYRASGVIFHCQTCKRITIVQVMGHLKENIRATTIQILESIQDHPTGQATLWSAYQLNVEVPRRYRLDKHKLLSGYLLFSFVDGSRRVSIERYGIADVVLKEHDLESWFRSKYAKAIRGYGFSIESSSDDSDERLALIGEQTRLIDHVPMAPALMIDKVMRRKTFAANLWRCYRSNRIYVVQAIAKRDAAKTASEIAASIPCH